MLSNLIFDCLVTESLGGKIVNLKLDTYQETHLTRNETLKGLCQQEDMRSRVRALIESLWPNFYKRSSVITEAVC